MNRTLLLIPLGLGLSIAGFALAQSAPEGIDLEAIRARSAEHAQDANALAATVRTRAEAVHVDALQTQGQAQAALAPTLSPQTLLQAAPGQLYLPRSTPLASTPTPTQPAQDTSLQRWRSAASSASAWAA